MEDRRWFPYNRRQWARTYTSYEVPEGQIGMIPMAMHILTSAINATAAAAPLRFILGRI